MRYDKKPNLIIPKYYQFGRIIYNDMNAQQSELDFDCEELIQIYLDKVSHLASDELQAYFSERNMPSGKLYEIKNLI